MPFVALPYDIFEVIVSLLHPDHIATLKCLSLVNTRFRDFAQSKLFRYFVIRFQSPGLDTGGLLSFLSAKPFLQHHVRELYLVDLPNLTDVRTNPSLIKKSNNMRALLTALSWPTAESLVVHVQPTALEARWSSYLVTQIPSTFRNLKHLQLENVYNLDITCLSPLPYLKYLELIRVRLRRSTTRNNNANLPEITRLVLGGCTTDTPKVSPITLIAAVVCFTEVEELAVWLSSWSSLNETASELVRHGITKVKSLSLRFTNPWSRPGTSPHVRLEIFPMLRNLNIFYPLGVSYVKDRQQERVCPAMTPFGSMVTPSTISHISFSIVWWSTMRSQLHKWLESQLRCLDFMIDKNFDRRWKDLSSIDFQLLFDGYDEERASEVNIPLDLTLVPRITSRGVNLSTLPNRVITSRAKWPYYARSAWGFSKGKAVMKS